MSDDSTDQARGRRQLVSLSSLYLDPNNYRFVHHPDYRLVSPEDIFKPHIQRRTTALVLGKSQADVQDLIASIKENGWLDIDPILAERRDGRFLVIEGNRRVATLKHLKRRYDDDAADLGRLDPVIFSKVPVVLHDAADEQQYLVMMGLHHISGKRSWPAINRALAMKSLQQHFDGDADAVCRALGVRKQDFNRSVRTLALVDVYKKSDYGDQFSSDQYTLFREVLGSPAIREWLGWDDAKSRANDQANLDRLFSWMSKVVDVGEDDSDEADADPPPETDAIITSLGHVRELAKMINDSAATKRLDETRSLQEATLSSSLLAKKTIDSAIGLCENSIQQLNIRSDELAPDDLDRVEHLTSRLGSIAFTHKQRPVSTGRLPWEPFNEITRSQLADLSVQCYRGIDGLALRDLRRINVIAGVNNAGKTSLLEAIYLLARQNDEAALLDVIRWRGRIEGEPRPRWLVDQIQPVVHVKGRFDVVEQNVATTELRRIDDPDDSISNQTSFLTMLAIKSTYGGQNQSTNVVLFGDRPRRTRFHGRHWLCRSALTGPFWGGHAEALESSNEVALEIGIKAKVIDFIKAHIDERIENIELANQYGRFLVTHSDFNPAPDLSAFGDGLRRIFEIGLLFSSVRGGVLLIDEFENAIHTALLSPFTRMVQELAAEHNVQVFLTTHSKETIDAFIKNGYRTDDIAGYGICRRSDGVRARRFDGDRLLKLNKAVDFDLRGVR